MDSDVKIFETVDQFVLQSQSSPDVTDASRLRILAEAVDLLSKVPASCRALMARVLESLSNLSFGATQFSVTDTVFSDEYRKAAEANGIPKEAVFSVLLNALQIFLSAVEGGQAGTRELLWDITMEVIRAAADFYRPQPVVPPTVAEIVNDRLTARVFKPAKVTFDLFRDIGVEYVFYQPELAPGNFGPDIRGLAFVPRTDIPKAKQQFAANSLFILLETGEHIVVPKNALNLASINDAEDYEQISPSLLLQAVVAAPLLVRMGVCTPETASKIGTQFGGILVPHTAVLGDVAAIQPLEQVFIQASERGYGASTANITGPTGASVRFPCDGPTGGNYAVVLNARLTPTSHYLVSNLVQTSDDNDDVIVMKNDYPRQLSPYGVYLFPRADALFSFTVFPHNFVLKGDS